MTLKNNIRFKQKPTKVSIFTNFFLFFTNFELILDFFCFFHDDQSKPEMDRLIAGNTTMFCKHIEYFSGEEYSPDPNDSTGAIPCEYSDSSII